MLSAEPAAPVDPLSVFLNVPFDTEYSSLFLALIAGLAGLGRVPRCVLEVESGGRNRLDRLFGLMATCGASIHDLSRVTLSGDLKVPRFNMPFELGIHLRALPVETPQLLRFRGEGIPASGEPERPERARSLHPRRNAGRCPSLRPRLFWPSIGSPFPWRASNQ
jgi:hypothetical protein